MCDGNQRNLESVMDEQTDGQMEKSVLCDGNWRNLGCVMDERMDGEICVV